MKRFVSLIITFTLSVLFSYSQVAGDYRSVATGNWNVVTTWEMFNGAIWVAAGATPNNTNGTITIRSPHIVSIPAAVTIDQVIIDPGATVQSTAGIIVTINNSGIVASELVVNGTYLDGSTSSAVWNAGATWSLGVNGNYIKTRNTSSNNWQANYEGGIATIPATSNWILRKVAAAQPQITTIGAFYGNMIFENTVAGTWTTTAGATFQGAGGFPTIKGNLDLGGAGAFPIVFLNQHTNATPTTVLGNVIIRAGNTFQNYGTGLEIQGTLTNNGTISYDANDGRNLNFTGGNVQSITNTGTLGIFNFGINKGANSLTLNNPITVDNLATFTNGIVNSTIANLFILNTAATVTVIPTTSFVNGPVRRIGPTGITFPIGKVATYRPLTIGNGAGAASVNIYTQDFNAGAAGWTLNQVTGPEGADANFFTISGNEGGCQSTFPPATAGIVPSMGAPTSCGLVNANATLHVTSVFNPTGGAAYDAGGLCGFLFCPQSDRRCLTPVISTVGFAGLELAFDYIEGGAGVLDNAMVYYSINGGGSWILLDDMPKSSTVGCAGQALWVTRVLALPATCDNNPNVRFAFTWINNDDGAGTDPSFALDNVIVRQVAPTASFTAEYFPNNPQVPFGNVLVPSLTSLSNCEYWTVNRDASTEARTIGLSWNAATCFNTAFASFEVARYDGIGVWQDHDGIVVGAAGGGTVTTPLNVSTFIANNPFAIAYVPLPLPIELIDFNGSCDNGLVKLTWQTASETNNDYFLIEKSADMIDWKEVSRISGAGNSNSILSYSYIDAANSQDIYYRLTQFDFNGDSKSFSPISIKCENLESPIVVYPNPSNGIINISLADKTSLDAVMVYSSLGQMVLNVQMSKSIGKTVLSIDLSKLSSGTYYLKMLVNGEWISKPITMVK